MDPIMLEQWAKINGKTIPEALKYLENEFNTKPKQQKGPFAEGPTENNLYDSF